MAEQRVTASIPALDKWLLAATRGLCDEACRRISAEMRTHVADSVRGMCAEGMSEDAALEQAVRQLGSARAARRRFRATDLTRGEYRLYSLRTAPPNIANSYCLMFFSMCTVALAGAFAYRLSLTYFDSQHFPPSLSDAACLLGLFVLMLKQADKLARTRRARRLVLAIQAGKYISVASFIFYVWCVHGIDNGVFLIVLAGYATLEAFRTTGLLLKLRRVPPERSGLG